MQPLDAETAVVAAGARARHGASLEHSDALVLAAAIRSKAEVLVTTDRGWPRSVTLDYTGRLVVL